MLESSETVDCHLPLLGATVHFVHIAYPPYNVGMSTGSSTLNPARTREIQLIMESVLSLSISISETSSRAERTLHQAAERLKNGFGASHDSIRDTRLLSIQLRIEFTLSRLAHWRKLWALTESKHVDYSRKPMSEAIWGEDGTPEIHKLLRDILGASLTLEEVLTREDFHRRQFRRRFKDLFAKRNDLVRGYEDATRILDTLNTQLEFLHTTSELYFRSQHQSIMPNSSRVGYADLQVLRKFELARKPFVGLFQSFSQFGDALRLKMGMYDNDSSKLCLQIFVDPSSDRKATKELVIEQVEKNQVDPDEIVPSIKLDAIGDVTYLESELEPIGIGKTYLSYHLEGREVYFRITSGIVEGPVQISRLSDLLFNHTSQSIRSISLAEKVELAYKIAESGLWLLGTPWLSNLSSEQLLRMTIGDRKPQYVLPVELMPFIGSSYHTTSMMSKSSQISSIGAVLAEIALNTPLDMNPYEPGLEFFSSLAKEIDDVEHKMGFRYGRAVQFCLRNIKTRANSWSLPPSDREEMLSSSSYVSPLLEDYYSHVFKE